MSIPGFTAIASSGRAGYTSASLSFDSNSKGVVPALPIGGYGQIACVKAICKFRPKDCASAWHMCGGSEGVECQTSTGGGCILWTCNKNPTTGTTTCYCIAYGPMASSVTCCYAGDCTTFW